MRFSRLLLIPTLLLVVACGGGGGGSASSPSAPGAFQVLREAFDSGYRSAEGMAFTDLARGPTSGQYRFLGQAGLDSVGTRTAITRDEVYQLVDGIKVEDLVAHPELLAQVELTADFTKDRITGRLHGFRTATDVARGGEITLADGVIDDGYFHYNGSMQGTLEGTGGRRNVAGYFFGDFLGQNAAMSGGLLAFVAEKEGYVGVFITKR